MRESDIVADFTARFSLAAPNAVVFKHADRTTIGIPDVSITYRQRTIWVEFKNILPNYAATFVKRPWLFMRKNPEQIATLDKLARTGSFAFYLAYMPTKIAYIDGIRALEWFQKQLPVEIPHFDEVERGFRTDEPFTFPRDYKSVGKLFSMIFA